MLYLTAQGGAYPPPQGSAYPPPQGGAYPPPSQGGHQQVGAYSAPPPEYSQSGKTYM